MTDPIIGILGGVGPESSIKFMKTIFELNKVETRQQQPRIIMDCNPQIPDFHDAWFNNGKSPAPMLIDTAVNIEKAGAGFLVIPCNTAHLYLDEINESISIPTISLLDVTINALQKLTPPVKKAALLATQVVADSKLYENKLSDVQIETLLPSMEEQQKINFVLSEFRKGVRSHELSTKLLKIINSLMQRGAEAIVLGCTEIPLILEGFEFSIPFIDTVQVLAEATLDAWKSKSY